MGPAGLLYRSMKKVISDSKIRTFDGAFWGILAEGMMFPVGFLVFIFLSRKLGPGYYGIYALTVNLIVLLEWLIVSFFDRATIKLTNESDHWENLATMVLHLQFLVSLLVAISLFFLASPIARILSEPVLAGYIRLMAIDIPIFCLAQTYKYLLIGIGSFRQKALSALGRWMSKLILVLLFVSLGFSIQGALWGNIGASLVELLIGCRFIRPALWSRWNFPFKRLLVQAAPLFLLVMSVRLFGKLDLFLLKYFGGTAIQAGLYSAAQNLSSPLGMISTTINPILLSTLSKECHHENHLAAQQLSRSVLKILFLLFPFALLASLSSSCWVPIVLGTAYQSAQGPFSILILSNTFLLLFSICTTILIAAGKIVWTLPMIAILLPFTLIGYWLAIPAWGMMGAAWVNGSFAFLVAMIALASVIHLWNHVLPVKTVWNVLLVLGVITVPFVWPPASGLGWVARLLIAVPFIPVYYFFSGEIGKNDFLFLKNFFIKKSRT